MTTSKGTIQGMTCVTAADDKHQIIIEAQAYGYGQEQATLKPMVEKIKDHFEGDVFADGCVLTADTGYCSENNLAFLHDQNITAVIPDNNFRLRDPIYSDCKILESGKVLKLIKRSARQLEKIIKKLEKYLIMKRLLLILKIKKRYAQTVKK